MIYETPEIDQPLTQGDLIKSCPLVYWEFNAGGSPVAATSDESVVVLTQACDLANAKTVNVQVAVVHTTQASVEQGILKAKTIKDNVRHHRVFGWYFLPEGSGQTESIVDLRDIHTLPRRMMEDLIREGHRTASIATPYREHLAQHFATTYSRIALPEPYKTETDPQ